MLAGVLNSDAGGGFAGVALVGVRRGVCRGGVGLDGVLGSVFYNFFSFVSDDGTDKATPFVLGKPLQPVASTIKVL